MNFFTELSNRWTENSPKFFKKLQYIGLYLASVGGGLTTIPSVPEKLAEIGGYLLTAGAVLAFVAKLPVKDPDYSSLDKKDDERK